MTNIFTILIAFLLSYISATCLPTMEVHNPREAETCADPSLAALYVSAFSSSRTAHVVRAQMDMVAYDTSVGNTDNWQFQGPSFLAWRTPQEFTVPFYQLTSSSGDNFLFLPAVNGSPPTAAGFSTEAIEGYVYSTQVCGSVPLLTASNVAAPDHWWTTIQSAHDALLAKPGWADAGIPFYVLPLA